MRWIVAAALALVSCACAPRRDVLTISGSALGAEGDVLKRQIARFAAAHPGLTVEIQPTPDAADARHQLYVEWLNAWATDPDVLQLDVVWTPEFAAAGWIRPIDESPADDADFIPAALAADRWRGRLFAVPWFVDVGMLYWRRDLFPQAPATFRELAADARSAIADGHVDQGFVWQGARYEGLVTVFLEHLAGFGGRILDDEGHVVVDAPPAVRALTFMRDAIYREHIVPSSVLTWQEEQTRFAFESGNAAFMRNWPYAAALLSSDSSRVRGKFGVAPMPHDGGTSGAALGGAQLAVNARTRQPREAIALVRFLTAPEQMLERAQIAGQYPARRSVFRDPRLAAALPIPPEVALRIIDRAIPRPVTPVYSELSGILQVHLHRALTRQEEPQAALTAAAREIRALFRRSGLEAPS